VLFGKKQAEKAIQVSDDIAEEVYMYRRKVAPESRQVL